VFRKRLDDHIGPLAEFTALRLEIDKLNELLWKVMSFQLTTAGATFGFSLSSVGRAPFLLIVPFSSYILMARWALYRQLVSGVTNYITNELSPRVPGGLHWERWIRESRGQFWVRHMLWIDPVKLMFPGVSFLAVTTVAGWLVIFHNWTSRGIALGTGLALVTAVGFALSVSSLVSVNRTLRKRAMEN
jgi:hypothetical protein